MATATTAGTITLPAAISGADTSIIIGAPYITPSSTAGAALTYTESSVNSYVVPIGAPLVIPFGSIASADLVYVGTDQITDVIYDGGAQTFQLAINGFDLRYMAGITAISVQPTVLAANIIVVLAGA